MAQILIVGAGPTGCTFSAMFHITPDIIHRRPKDYYINLRTIGNMAVAWAYIYERLWSEIFLTGGLHY